MGLQSASRLRWRLPSGRSQVAGAVGVAVKVAVAVAVFVAVAVAVAVFVAVAVAVAVGDAEAVGVAVFVGVAVAVGVGVAHAFTTKLAVLVSVLLVWSSPCTVKVYVSAVVGHTVVIVSVVLRPSPQPVVGFVVNDAVAPVGSPDVML